MGTRCPHLTRSKAKAKQHGDDLNFKVILSPLGYKFQLRP
uniref:Uncharacterized protein n=1 Tax=Physcomitrium patens TaxID=3218 RepID=A0A2K1KUB2_PHYPA|nr:hypothetical protein PHYPA_004352 [Physcomitrium patens]